MTVETLLSTWTKDRKLTINHIWLPAHTYEWDEETKTWEYWDGECWVSEFDNEQNGDPNFDPNEPEIDEEYSFTGTVDEFDRDEFDWLLDEDVVEVSEGVFEVRRQACD